MNQLRKLIRKTIRESLNDIMETRLPLPLSVIKDIQAMMEEHSDNLWIKNPLKNIVRDLFEYEYSDAIKALLVLEKDFPTLMDYKRHIRAIKMAERKYNAI